MFNNYWDRNTRAGDEIGGRSKNALLVIRSRRPFSSADPWFSTNLDWRQIKCVCPGLGIDIRSGTCKDTGGLGILGWQAFLETEMLLCVYGKICHADPLSSR